MKRLFLTAGLLLAAGSAWAGPTGTWRVTDNTTDIEIVPCGDALCGMVAWTDNPDQKDNKNPDGSKRNRPVLGITILQNMKPDGDKWVGSVYNARDGHTYEAKIWMRGEDALRLEGCLPGGMICGGQNWSRIAQPTVAVGQATTMPQPQAKQATAITPVPPQPQQAQTSVSVPAQQQATITSQVKENASRGLLPLDLDLSRITPDQAAEAGRSAADLINQMLTQHGGGARVDPSQAAMAARSTTQIIKSMSHAGQ
jgi:uncharacterized protein (DUF2147 family)